MKTLPTEERDLHREIAEFRNQTLGLGEDQAFVLFFVRAFITEDPNEALASLCGGTKDKGTDAVLIDDGARLVFIVQGKYRKGIERKLEGRNDILSFASLGSILLGDEKRFKEFLRDLSPEVSAKFEAARGRLLRKDYGLRLFYVTTGKCSANLSDEAEKLVRATAANSAFQLFGGRQILRLVADYLDGVAPPVPSLELELEGGNGVSSSGPHRRTDHLTGIESWIFSMSDVALARLYTQAGKRLFARNVRGFLGSTEINRGMEATIERESQHFWYYNNGVTIVCDEAKHETGHGRDILRVTNPQVINGQQTTRTLARNATKTPRASVLVRVIRVPRGKDAKSPDQFESLVSRIVSATNWQNAIRPSDLMATDRRQIEIEREFRKLDYWYMRKRQTRSEARRASGSRKYVLVKKEEIAQAVAACDLDPLVVREGKERLFEERLYGHVFPTSDPYYYLTRYRLMREVAYAAKGFPERAYAKWLVLNFCWTYLQPMVRGKANAEVFRRTSERNESPMEPLGQALNHAFKGALALFRKRRGTGERALDISSFFKRKGLHKEFQNFWRSSSNPARAGFRKAWKKFERDFAEAANS